MKNTVPPLSPAENFHYYKARVPKLHKSGSELRAPCPIHNGKRDSFSVNRETGEWFCHSSCGRGGSIFDLEAAISGVDFTHAREEVFRIVGRASSNGSAKRIVAEYNYTDEEGRLLYQCVRYTPKDFRQRRPDGHGGWVWNVNDVRRVLYRLPEILAAPTVFVVEGEKDADSLVSLGVAATCNVGGAGKWRKQYAETLRAKQVISIPDADEPGRKHAAAVLRSLEGVARSVKLLPMPGAKDVTEWIERGGTLEMLTQLVEQSAPWKGGPRQDSNGHATAAGSASVEIEEPEINKTRHFQLTSEGVFYVDEETDARTFVCTPLRVDAYTRDADSELWGRLLVWTDRNHCEHTWAMPMSALAGDGLALRETLLNGGVLIPGGKARQLLSQYIQHKEPGRSAVCVQQIGWYGRTFVLPDNSAIPGDAAEAIIYQTTARGEHFYRTAGTLEEWREQIGKRCVGNSRLVFSVSAAFAGPLLRPLNVEGGGFHLVGTSSTGKSTAQVAAGSVCGGGHGAHGFARSWRFTQNALESMAELHNDGLLILDEMREIPEAKDLDSIVYMLANGSGKGRMNKSMTAQRTLSWQLLFLSSGEIKLSEYAASLGARVKGGAEVRLLNIPADAGADMGAFEDIHGAESARAFAEQLKAASAKTYGTALRTFLTEWVRGWDANYARVATFITDFIAKEIPSGAAPEVGRALRRVALVAAAGELATSMAITGWEPGEARRAAVKCFKDWIQERGGAGQTDVQAGLRQVRAFIAVKGGSCFQSVVPHFDGRGNEMQERINERAGYWKEENGERQYLIFPDVFKGQVCSGLDSKLILQELDRKQLLVRGEGRNYTRKETVPNEGRIRVYVIKARILDEGEDD
jgi:uncharacterized protein (DUF927 family)